MERQICATLDLETKRAEALFELALEVLHLRCEGSYQSEITEVAGSVLIWIREDRLDFLAARPALRRLQLPMKACGSKDRICPRPDLSDRLERNHPALLYQGCETHLPYGESQWLNESRLAS